jgi:NTE family protein
MTAAKTVCLALQGGGAHGAFSWGVLDALLDDGRVAVEGVSGSSAGAMNGAALALGWEHGGPAAARALLEKFWRSVSGLGQPMAAWLRGPAAAVGGDLDWSPGYVAFDLMTRFLSPYQFNPLNLNPLRRVVEETLDFGALHACRAVKLFVAATAVRSGKIRIFDTHEVTADVLLASACLPFLFQAVEIGGEPYWDGGYMGNPAIYPLIYECRSPDVVLVQVNPIGRAAAPVTAREILDRVTEISFNATLMREMRAIAFVSRLIDEGRLDTARYKKLHVHVVEAEAEMSALGAASKFDTDWGFLSELRAIGRRAGADWLGRHYADIGQRSSVDLKEKFL